MRLLYFILLFSLPLICCSTPIPSSPIISWAVRRRGAVGSDGLEVMEQKRSHLQGEVAGVRWGLGGVDMERRKEDVALEATALANYFF